MSPDPTLNPPSEKAHISASMPAAASPAAVQPGIPAAPEVSDPQTQPQTCPSCGRVNDAGVRFCTQCHSTLLYRCPLCSHVQTHGHTCDACGTNFDVFWSSYFALKNQEDDRVARDKLKAEFSWLMQIVMLPFAGARWLIVFLTEQVFGRIAGFFSNR